MHAYITAYASMSCAGDTEALMDAVYNKKSAVSVDTGYIPTEAVGLGTMEYKNFYELLNDVVDEVLRHSNLQNFNKTLLIVGSSVGGMAESEQHYFHDKNYKNIDPARHAINVIEDSLNARFSFLASRSISTACTSSANALLLAKRLINIGAYENILVVGADALCYTTVCGFHALGVLSPKPCRPFDKEREGMNVAEGIAALLVQNQAASQAIEIAGAGASSDAYHITNPDPQAKGAISAMQNALLDAKISAKEVDYINAHGTGTIANDNVEALAIETLFDNVPVSSTKAITGHTLGAAGALEAVIACEVIKRRKIPPQTGLHKAQNTHINIPTKVVEKDIKYLLSNSFAFGGNNTSILLSGVHL